jgi:hypothetical protein
MTLFLERRLRFKFLEKILNLRIGAEGKNFGFSNQEGIDRYIYVEGSREARVREVRRKKKRKKHKPSTYVFSDIRTTSLSGW